MVVEKATTPVTKTNGSVQRWDPFGLLDSLETGMEHIWRRPFSLGTWPLAFPRWTAGKAVFMPQTDVFEKDGILVYKAELPGLTKEDVQVEIVDRDLVIKGESKTEKEVNDAAYYRMERSYGSFYRRLPLPIEVKPEEITATLADGVLEVRIPRPVTGKPEATRIPVA